MGEIDNQETPNKKMEEVMQGLGKQPGRISGMINITKLWYWFKNRKNAKRYAQSEKEGKENEKVNKSIDDAINRCRDGMS